MRNQYILFRYVIQQKGRIHDPRIQQTGENFGRVTPIADRPAAWGRPSLGIADEMSQTALDYLRVIHSANRGEVG